MPITTEPRLQTTDITNPLSIPPIPHQAIARFSGGTHNGTQMAIQSPERVLQFPVYDQTWVSFDAAANPQTIGLSVQSYYLSGRTIEWTPNSASASVLYDYQVATTAGSNVYQHTWGSSWIQNPLTPEEEARRAREVAQRQKRQRVAHKRARRLLLTLLDEAQQHEYAQSKAFTVIAKNGKVFRLRKGRTAELLGHDGVPTHAYCIHLTGRYAPEDTLVALLLSLQTDPDEFERIANVTKLQRPRTRDDLIVRAGEAAVAVEEARRVAGYRAEHVRESRALLRAEGLSEAEVAALRDPPNHRSGLLLAA